MKMNDFSILLFDLLLSSSKTKKINLLNNFFSSSAITEKGWAFCILSNRFEKKFINAKDLKEALRNPIGKDEYGLLFTDGSKFGRGEQLHFALQGVWEFQAQYKRLPVPRYEDDAKECIRFAKEYNEKMFDQI